MGVSIYLYRYRVSWLLLLITQIQPCHKEDRGEDRCREMCTVLTLTIPLKEHMLQNQHEIWDLNLLISLVPQILNFFLTLSMYLFYNLASTNSEFILCSNREEIQPGRKIHHARLTETQYGGIWHDSFAFFLHLYCNIVQ